MLKSDMTENVKKRKKGKSIFHNVQAFGILPSRTKWLAYDDSGFTLKSCTEYLNAGSTGVN